MDFLSFKIALVNSLHGLHPMVNESIKIIDQYWEGLLESQGKVTVILFWTFDNDPPRGLVALSFAPIKCVGGGGVSGHPRPGRRNDFFVLFFAGSNPIQAFSTMKPALIEYSKRSKSMKLIRERSKRIWRRKLPTVLRHGKCWSCTVKVKLFSTHWKFLRP